MILYLIVGPEAWHIGVHHTSDNSAYQPEMEIWHQFQFSARNLKFEHLPSVKSLLPVHLLNRLHCLPLGKVSLCRGWSVLCRGKRITLMPSIFKIVHKKNLDGLNPGVGGSSELSNCCLLLGCLSVNRSQGSLTREIDLTFDVVWTRQTLRLTQ